MKHGFELHGFFLEPKTAYLEALLYLQIFGLCVVFLVFMALKVKPKKSDEFSKPFDHVRVKNHFFSIWSLMWPSKFFFGLFHFFLRYFMSKKSTGTQ